MDWKTLLTTEIESTYNVTNRLIDLVEASMLNWKPSTGNNWMTTGQLLKHIAEGCGGAFKGCITGDWGMPPDMNTSDAPPENMLPPAEKYPTVQNVAEAKQLLAEDLRVTLDLLAHCSKKKLDTQPTPVPWDPTPMVLGQRLLQMVEHLKQHKGQLFYYLKLQGKPVNTGTLWGM